jgi:DNA-directed RNA polymerase subunit RPC12/RpoP
MSIELHCPQCGKQIKAPDNAGGRYGKCPYCGGRAYIPMPDEQREEIGVAPLDEDELERERRMRREALALEAQVLHETKPPPPGVESPTRGGPTGAHAEGEVVDMAAEVNRYLVAMRDSKLEQADKAVGKLARAGARARDYVQGLMIDEMPLPIDNVPPPVLKGFLKSLLGRLEE